MAQSIHHATAVAGPRFESRKLLLSLVEIQELVRVVSGSEKKTAEACDLTLAFACAGVTMENTLKLWKI